MGPQLCFRVRTYILNVLHSFVVGFLGVGVVNKFLKDKKCNLLRDQEAARERIGEITLLETFLHLPNAGLPKSIS